MDFFWDNITHAPIWIAAAQIIGVNIILSGDNAVVIAMACMTLPPKQRLWGMIMGAGVAVLLRVVFTLVVAEAMNYPFLKLVGGVLLFWVATKLVTEDSEGEGVKSGETLWSAVRIARESVAVLMDEELPADVSERMLELVRQVPGVVGAHDLRTRISGDRWFVQLHLELPGDMRLSQAHTLCDQAVLAIRAEFPRAEVLVHADPLEVVGRETIS